MADSTLWQPLPTEFSVKVRFLKGWYHTHGHYGELSIMAESTNWPKSASGLLNFNGRFSASSLRCSRGAPDPYA